MTEENYLVCARKWASIYASRVSRWRSAYGCVDTDLCLFSFEDVRQDLLLYFFEKVLPKIKGDGFNWQGYINLSLRRCSLNMLRRRKGAVAVVVPLEIEVSDALKLDFLFYDMADDRDGEIDMEVGVKKLSKICQKFGIAFDKNKPMKGLERLLRLVLDEFTDAQFDNLTAKDQKFFLELGHAYEREKVEVNRKQVPRIEGGLKQVVDDLVKQDPTAASRDILKICEANDIHFTKPYLYKLIYQARKRLAEGGEG